MADSKTLAFYNSNARAYHERNAEAGLDEFYQSFTGLLSGSRLLDFGCGTGRDARYFTEAGYEVLGIDGSEGMLEMARSVAPLASFRLVDFSRPFDLNEIFDGIWASASLLHLNDHEFRTALQSILKHLRSEGGALYLSLKESDPQPLDNERYFRYWSQAELLDVLKPLPLRLQRLTTTERRGVIWLNALFTRH